jgi:hypothetical protein
MINSEEILPGALHIPYCCASQDERKSDHSILIMQLNANEKKIKGESIPKAR